MVICPQCNIEHDAGEEFCRKCGKFLLIIEDPAPEEEGTKFKLTCPRCQVLYKKGNYCRKCGSLLMQGTPSPETYLHPLEKKSVRKWSREWLSLLKKEKELKLCMSNLKTQRDKVSSDVFNPIFVHYKDQLESLSPLQQEIEMELESVRRRASEEIDFLEKELKPIPKRLEQLQSLYKLGAIAKPDFVREKKKLRKEIKSKEKEFKKCRQILSLLPSKMGESIASPGFMGNLLRPFILFTASVILLLIIVGGYFLWQHHSPSGEPILKNTVASPFHPPSSSHPNTTTRDPEAEKIRSLFENIREANLNKDIDLFMSCYSRDFNDREGKRLDAIETWGFYNYLDLSYDLRKQTISRETANVRLEWLIRTSKKVGGKLEDRRALMDVTLKKEDGRWKIKEIKPVS